MAPGPDDRRNDHTRPTIAFIALAVTAAAVMTAGMTSRADTPLAADRPPRITSGGPTPSTAAPSPEALAVPDFSITDVVTLTAAEAARRPVRSKTRRDSADASPDRTSTGSGSSGSTTTPGSGGGTGPRTAGGSVGASGSGSGAGTRGGSGGSGGPGASGGSGTADGSPGSRDAGPGRSTTGQGKARGQQDATPGRGGGATRTARTTGRAEAPRTRRATGRR